MVKIIPFNKEMREEWNRLKKMALGEIEDMLMKHTIEQILYYHELEQSGEWKHADPHTDYSDESFEVFLEDQTLMSLEDFRLQERAIFEHLDEVKRDGLGVVCKKYYPKEHKAIFEKE